MNVSSKTRIFIDGQAGTTGLDLRARLADRDEFELLEIDPAVRKDPAVRRELLSAADIAVLCLPDDAAREAVELLQGSDTRVLDASTAHRVDPEWAYGLPEMHSRQREAIAKARLVSNPGCYPQGVILAVSALIEKGWLNATAPITVHAVSGYSGGGNKLIDQLEHLDSAEEESWRVRAYSLALQHKHVPEMQRFSGLATAPLFTPSVGAYYKGMLVFVPLPSGHLADGIGAAEVAELLATRYADEQFIDVLPLADAAPDGYLDATACNGTNRIEFIVTGNDTQTLIAARYDNLGKGAGGAAVQNLNLMCGLPEQAGLQA